MHLSVRLDYQVEIGESIAISGSTRELGSRKKNMAMDRTKSGWVCVLKLKGGESVKLEELILDFADSTEILVFIGSLRKLKKLSASCYESLREIPSLIGDLQNLQHLDISGSTIEKLPSAIGRLIPIV